MREEEQPRPALCLSATMATPYPSAGEDSAGGTPAPWAWMAMDTCVRVHACACVGDGRPVRRLAGRVAALVDPRREGGRVEGRRRQLLRGRRPASVWGTRQAHMRGTVRGCARRSERAGRGGRGERQPGHRPSGRGLAEPRPARHAHGHCTAQVHGTEGACSCVRHRIVLMRQTSQLAAWVRACMVRRGFHGAMRIGAMRIGCVGVSVHAGTVDGPIHAPGCTWASRLRR